MTKKRYHGRASFVAMSVFFVAIIILIHGTMAFQISKIKMNEQLKLTSGIIMDQFIMSYGNFEQVKSALIHQTTAQYDQKLVGIYKNIDKTYQDKQYKQLYRPLSDDQLFEISIRPINVRTQKFLTEKIGVDLNSLNPYQVISMAYKGVNSKTIEKRLLVGKTSDQSAVILIEMTLDIGEVTIEEAKKSIQEALGNNMYMSSFSNRFYVLSHNGNLLYSTGTKLNKGLMQATDSYSGSKITDLIFKTDTVYTEVLYRDTNGLNRSALRVQRSESNGLVYVLELDQDKVFSQMNQYVQYFWYMSFVILLVNLGVISYFWRKNKLSADWFFDCEFDETCYIMYDDCYQTKGSSGEVYKEKKGVLKWAKIH